MPSNNPLPPQEANLFKKILVLIFPTKTNYFFKLNLTIFFLKLKYRNPMNKNNIKKVFSM